MHKITNLKEFLKSEAVLLISAFVAIISMFFIPPSLKYMDYIDFRTLSLLFCLMAAVSGLRSIGLFDSLANAIIPRFKTSRSLSFALVLLCFYSAMLITNDVALITFVPLTIIIYRTSNLMNQLVYTIILETAAANLGSTFTPVGNPQNLYLYSYFKIQPFEFFKITLPIILIGMVLLSLAVLLCKRQTIAMNETSNNQEIDRKKLIIYALLFLLCLCSVFYMIDYRVLVVLVCIILYFTDKTLFKSIDYGLLITFVCFFIFVGNLERMESVHNLLSKLIKGHELLSSVLFSQVISNVPAAVLLSGFTEKYKALIIGANIGGLGTIVASLASLISFKFYVKTENAKPLSYLAKFSLVNIILLIPLLGFSILYY